VTLIIKRFALLVLALSLYFCGGDSETGPDPTPTPIPYYSMLGEWSGTVTISSRHSGLGTTTRWTCAHLWTITLQERDAFSGTFLQTSIPNGDDCGSDAGTVEGNVSLSGDSLAARLRSYSPSTSGCSLSGSTEAIGAVNADGTSFTIYQNYTLSCEHPILGPYTRSIHRTVALRRI
jgi:hypothetical protein